MPTLQAAIERLVERLADKAQFAYATWTLRTANDALGAEPGSPERRQAFVDIDETLDWLHRQHVDVTEARRARAGPITRPAQAGSPLDAAKVTLGMVELLWLARQGCRPVRPRASSDGAAAPRRWGGARGGCEGEAEEAPTPEAMKVALVRVAASMKAVYPVLLRTEAPM